MTSDFRLLGTLTSNFQPLGTLTSDFQPLGTFLQITILVILMISITKIVIKLDFLYKPSYLWLNLSVCDWPLDGTHLCWRYQRIPVVPMDMPEDIVITILVIPMIIALLYHFFGERKLNDWGCLHYHCFNDSYDHFFVISLFWWKGDFHQKIST